MNNMSHFITKCSCGNVIAQCKCMSCNKHVETVMDGCQECIARKENKADITKPTYEYLWNYLSYQYPATKGDIRLRELCMKIVHLKEFAGNEVKGLNNKYKCAVDMAAHAQNEIVLLKDDIESLKEDLDCEKRCAELQKDAAMHEINILKNKLKEMTEYADKLASGLPCLPKDIENLREANLKFATENENLKKELSKFRKESKKEVKLEIELDKDGSLRQYTPKVNGKSFYCHCGCNVFHKYVGNENLFICNGCDEHYDSE